MINRGLNEHLISGGDKSLYQHIEGRYNPWRDTDPFGFYSPVVPPLHPSDQRVVKGLRGSRVAIDPLLRPLDECIHYRFEG